MLLEMNYMRFMLSSERFLYHQNRTETIGAKLENKTRAKEYTCVGNGKIEEYGCVVGYILEGRVVRIESRKGRKNELLQIAESRFAYGEESTKKDAMIREKG